MDISLDNNQVATIADKQITLIPYTDMQYYKDIDEIFSNDCVLMNYQSADNYGHWVGLYKKGNKISFFDSYGHLPDTQQEYIPKKYRIESGQDYPYLVALLNKWQSEGKNRSVHYNDEQFQRYSSKITTCGRWVGYYLRYCDTVSIEQFEREFTSIKNKAIKQFNLKNVQKDMYYDKLIVELTDPFLA